MIFTDRTITVRKGESRIDEPIVVYRGDYELEVRFTILNSRFKFMSGTNMIESEKASYGQLAILTPYGGNIFSDIVRCNDGSVTFVLTAEMLNQIDEVGLYSFQIRLMDYNKESRVSIPPIEFGIEVREPIASEDHDNSVNDAIVGYSIAKVVNPSEEKNVDTFDENGNYNKTKWETGDRISEVKLNKIEDAIDILNGKEINDILILDKKISANFNILSADISRKANTEDVNSKINSIASGSPKGVYSTVDKLTEAYPNGNSHIYIVSADGCWYYWEANKWNKGGVYQSTSIGDNTVSFNSLTSETKKLGTQCVSGKYLPPAQDVIIDVDVKNKRILVNATISTGPAYSGSTLEKQIISTMNTGMGDTDDTKWVSLDYSDISTTAVLVCYDYVNNVYRLRPYNQKLLDNEIRLAFVRVPRDQALPYGDSHLVTYNGGNPGRQLQHQIEKGEIKSKFFVKKIWLSKFGTADIHEEKMIVDAVNRTIKIPVAEYVYGKTAIQVEKSYSISYSDNIALLYIFFNLDTGLFEAHGYGELNSWGYLRDKNYLLYDMYRVNKRQSIFTNEITTIGDCDLEYFDLENLLDLKKNKLYQGHTDHKYQIIDSNNIIYDPTPQFQGKTTRFSVMSRREKHANLSKISKSDNLDAITLYNPYEEYKFAIIGCAQKKDGRVVSVFDSGWILHNMSPANQHTNFTTGRYLDVGTLFEKAKYTCGYDVQNIFIHPLVARVDDKPIQNLDTLSNLHFVIHTSYKSERYTSDNMTNISGDDIDVMRCEENFARAQYRLNGCINGFNRIHVNVGNPRVDIDGVTYEVNASVHYIDGENRTIFDTNWFYTVYDRDTLEFEASILNNWNKRYSPKDTDSIYSVLVRTTGFEVYFGIETRGLTSNQVKDILDKAEISYQIIEESAYDYERLPLTGDIKKDLLDNIIRKDTTADINGVSFINSNRMEYSTNTKIGSILIPEGAKGFIVEFRAGVSTGEGSIGFVDNTHKITIINAGMKSFKMRFNKKDSAIFKGDITAIPPSGGVITIQGLKVVPVFEEVAISNHNNSHFYLHRGYSSVYPENTLLAVEEACKRGCSIIEIDTFTSTDNKTLICHDNTLGRTNAARPTINFSDSSLFTRSTSNSIRVDNSIIVEFAINDQLEIDDNGVKKTAIIRSITSSEITVDLTTLTGPINSIKNKRRLVETCSQAEFLGYEVGGYMNSVFDGEHNATFEDYIKVAKRYNAALLLDIRIMREDNFKNEIAGLLDKYDYWNACYFMHNHTTIARYNGWAKDIDREIVGIPITWSNGEALIEEIRSYGSGEYSNISNKGIAIQSSAATEENVALAHSYGMRVYVFTVNSISEAQRVFRMGVDVVGGDYFSDDTAILW